MPSLVEVAVDVIVLSQLLATPVEGASSSLVPRLDAARQGDSVACTQIVEGGAGQRVRRLVAADLRGVLVAAGVDVAPVAPSRPVRCLMISGPVLLAIE